MHQFFMIAGIYSIAIMIVCLVGLGISKFFKIYEDFTEMKSNSEDYYTRLNRDRKIDDLANQVKQHKDVLVALSDYHELELRNMPVPRSHVFFVKKS